MIRCSCLAVDIINQKMEIIQEIFGTRTMYFYYKSDLLKEFPKMKSDGPKSPSDDFLQVFTKIKCDGKLTESNVQL